MSNNANEKAVVEFLKMVGSRKSSAEVENFYHPEIQQIEFPPNWHRSLACEQVCARLVPNNGWFLIRNK